MTEFEFLEPDLLDEDLRMVREQVRRFVREQIVPYADAWEESGEIPRKLFRDLGEMGFLGMRHPVEYGGGGLGPLASVVLGEELAMPVILGPVGLAGMFAPRAEVQAIRAATAAGVPFVESTVSICGLDEVARASVKPPWFQLYVMRDRDFAEGLMQQAGDVGSPVLVLTVDLAVVGARFRDVRNAMVGDVGPGGAIRRGLDLASHPRWIKEVALGGKPLTFGNLESAVPGARTPDSFKSWVDAQFDPTVTWDDVSWVRRNWSGKLVVKGVLDADDARRAVDAGVDGVVVSNHGGRQLDGVPSTVAALPAVLDAVGDRTEVLVDGGVRSGLDVVRFLALGARACLVGRAWAWAVAARGEAGVAHVLDVLRSDMDVALALTGTTDVADLDRSILIGS